MNKKMTIRVVAIAVSLMAGSVLVATLSPIGTAGAHSSADTPADASADAWASALMDRAARMTERREQFADYRDADRPDKGERAGERFGHGERFGGQGQMKQKWDRRTHFSTQVADFLEMDRRGLGMALRDGATLAELAGDRVDELVAELVATASERIEQAVADEKLDRDRADEILADAEERATSRVNGEHPTRRGGPSGLHRSMRRLAS